jgi:uncharacterized protein
MNIKKRMEKNRYLYSTITEDLSKKMVFLGGPRQVGKTTLSQMISRDAYGRKSCYLNWDNRGDRQRILSREYDAEAKILIFDEVHKFKEWKTHLKGEYDKGKDDFSILVTGSARLDVFRKGGDSLMGRYHYYRLHPFSLPEMRNRHNGVVPFEPIDFSNFSKADNTQCEELFTFGGFPEPLLAGDMKTWRRFQNERVDRLVREDIRDLENIRDLSAIQILVELLPGKVGSLLSLNSLREDLQVAHKTVSSWMDILEKFYYHYRIYPFAYKTIKSLRKEPKLYLWDWSEVKEKPQRLENMVASHLLKFVHYLYDAEGYKSELFFLRDIEGREVDFLVTIDRKPWFAVEVKNNDTDIDKNLRYFKEKLQLPLVYQIVSNTDIDVVKDGVRVMSVNRFLSGLV